MKNLLSRHKEALHFVSLLARHPRHRRYALRWLLSRQDDYLFRRKLPWLVFGAIDTIGSQEWVDSRVLEYGSGASTLFWHARGARLVSVEHDPGWHEQVACRLPSSARIDLRLVKPEPAGIDSTSVDASDPDAYASADPDMTGMTFRRYASTIDEFAPASFDLVMIDGRARPSCVKHAVSGLKPGGQLILDNSERAYYLSKAGRYVHEYAAEHYQGPVPVVSVISETTIFRKPA